MEKIFNSSRYKLVNSAFSSATIRTQQSKLGLTNLNYAYRYFSTISVRPYLKTAFPYLTEKI